MKILHMMLSSFYIDNYSYQENILPRQNAKDGHQVEIIASTETFVNNQETGYLDKSTYKNSDGILVRRLSYSWWLPHFIMKKIRSYPGVYKLLKEINPDVILFHGSAAWELLTVARYKKNHPDVRLFLDSHSDGNNSGQNFISKWLLHRIFYRLIIQRAIPNLDRIFYISLDAKKFLTENYKIPESLMEFYPLGGIILDENERIKRREIRRAELGLRDEDILLLHTGKMDKLKRTEDILVAFSKVKNDKLRLVLIGSISDEIRSRIDALIEADKRVSFLGWKSADDLLGYLCACDMYVQPGGQSATMQNAMCVYSPVMLYPHLSHIPYLDGNGYFVTTIEDIIQAFLKISDNPSDLVTMRKNSERVAKEILDYRTLAARLYR